MRVLKNLLVLIVVVASLGVAGLVASGNGYLVTAALRTYGQGEPTANIDDHRFFSTRIISASRPQPWPERDPLLPLPGRLQSTLETDHSIAFLVAHRGQVIAEQYFQGYDARSKTNSFSMAKTVMALLLGIAIEDGLVTGMDQRLTDWLPEFEADPKGVNATLGSLVTMDSGYEWDERYYSPMSPTVELLYGPDVESFVLAGYFSARPGERFYYSSASTQLLAVALTRALKRRDPQANLSRYLSENSGTRWE